MKQHLMTRTASSILMLAGVVVLAVGFALVFRSSLREFFSSQIGEMTASAYADAVMQKCAKKSFPPACYDEELPKLLDKISMEEIFEITKIVQQRDPQYVYCHVLGHKVSSQEASKSPEGWKDVITRCPATFCNNGCLHGALIQHFNKESLNDEELAVATKELHDVCEPRGNWHPVEVERSMCYHAIGHLALYVTAGDPGRAAILCNDIGRVSGGRNYVQTCTEGVFMQIFQPLEPEDFALVERLTPTKTNVPEFCGRFRGANRHSYDACRREAWPLSRKEILTPSGYEAYCAYTGDPSMQKTCYATLMNLVTIEYAIERNAFDEITAFCDSVGGLAQSACFAESARQLVQLDSRLTPRARAMCKEAEKRGVETECWEELIRIISWSFPADTAVFEGECEALPAAWTERCLEAGRPAA